MPRISKQSSVDITFCTRFLFNLQKWDQNSKVILFGSRARNNNRSGSDYDFIIISDNFTGVRDIERWRNIQEKIKPYCPAITLEIHCFTNNEWQKRKGTLLFTEVNRDGIELKDLVNK